MSNFEGIQNKFPTGKQRKESINFNARKTEVLKNINLEQYYSWLDSCLDSNPEGSSFFRSFRDIIPSTESSLGEYIEKILSERRGNAIGVEFGGPGKELFKGFSKNFFNQSVGVTLVDYTDKKEKTQNHTVLEGNIFSPDTYIALNNLLEGKKVDLIIERMAKGLENVPSAPHMIGIILQKWYELLNDGGIMFVQTPVVFNTLLDKWANMIQKDYADVLEFDYKKGVWNDNAIGSVFRLHKLPNAPIELPFLNIKTVYNTPKYSPS
jgi:hypothetical protein